MAEGKPEFANFQSSMRLVERPMATKSTVSFSSASQANLTKSTTGLTASKSVMKLEEKFKKYVSEADLLFRTLSKLSEVGQPEDMCDSAHLLERNTESFRCLAQLMLSNSSLMKNRLFLFPPLEDPGIDVAFNFREPPPENDDIGIEKYRKLCKDMEIVPISRILNSLETDTLDLKYYGLTSKQMKALTETMKVNARVQDLILQDNWLTVEMAQMVSDMIVENTALQYLSLQECRIGVEGAQKLGEVLASLQSLRSLDLSYNDIGDSGLSLLQPGLSQNIFLKQLNLSHNNITDESAETMEKILVENKILEELDLSWSGFNTAQGNKKLFSGFCNSDRIKNLNLAWNGIEDITAVRPLTRYLTKSKNLEELDLSNNRLVGQPLRAIRTAISKNHSLRVVKIGNNIFTPEDAHFLLTALAGKAKDPLQHLDMENMYINKESKLAKYPLILLRWQELDHVAYLKYIRHFILSLPKTPMTPDEFNKELKKQKIKKLDVDLVKGLMDLFSNKKREIECSELVKDYMSFYPDTQLPPPKPKKAKTQGKKGKRKDIEEQVIEVHDLEKQPSETEQPIQENRQSKMSLSEATPSRKSIQRPMASQANVAQRKSVSIIPKPSIMTGETIREVPEAEAAPVKSIIKIREGSKGELDPRKGSRHELSSKRLSELGPRRSSRSDLTSKRISTTSQGSKVNLEDELN